MALYGSAVRRRYTGGRRASIFSKSGTQPRMIARPQTKAEANVVLAAAILSDLQALKTRSSGRRTTTGIRRTRRRRTTRRYL